jgi:hypothetical protein
MAAVFGYFIWSTAVAQPWSVAIIVVFVACSAAIEMILSPKVLAPSLAEATRP